MKINYYKDINLTENRIDLYYNLIDGATKSIMDYLESYDFILGKYEDSTKRIYPNDILYVEIVEKRCFAYLSNEVFQIDYSLKNFLERFAKNGFVQIGKSMIVNIYRIDTFKADLYMKMNIFMENKEILILNRAYKHKFMTYLETMKELANENN